jgi:ribosome-associated translation inhibitor RaiA
MDNLQNNNTIYQATPDEHPSINEAAQNEIHEKTAKLTGYLKYKMNTHEYVVQKEGNEVLLPIRRNKNKFEFKIKENKTGIKLQDAKKKHAKTYDITLKGKTITTALSEDDLKFAEELTKEVEKLLKV